MFDYLFKQNLTSDEEQRILAETFKYYAENLNPGFLKLKRSVKHDAQGVEWRGEGVYMHDIHGHRFIDCLGGYGVFALGHRHPHVIKRVQETIERIGLYSQELLNPLQAVLAHEIAAPRPRRPAVRVLPLRRRREQRCRAEAGAPGDGPHAAHQLHQGLSRQDVRRAVGDQPPRAEEAVPAAGLRLPHRALRQHRVAAGVHHRRDRQRDHRADPGRGRDQRPAARVPARRAPALQRCRRADARR